MFDISKHPFNQQVAIIGGILTGPWDTILSQVANYKFKPAALEEALVQHGSSLHPQILKSLQATRIETQISNGLKKRPFSVFAEKKMGTSPGSLVKKTHNEGTLYTQKHYNIWLLKRSNPDVNGYGELACEYIATNMRNELMKREVLSPKVRFLQQEPSKHNLLSKYIPGFRSMQDLILNQDNVSDIKGFAKIFAAYVLVGNYDMNAGNIGVVNINSVNHYAGVDDGRGLSYYINIAQKNKSKIYLEEAPQTKLVTSSERKENILLFNREVKNYCCGERISKNCYVIDNDGEIIINPKAYNRVKPFLIEEDAFKKMDFAGELEAELRKVNIDELRLVIKLSLKNIREIYTDKAIAQEIEGMMNERIGLGRLATDQEIEDKIIKNIVRLQGQLHVMAKEAMALTFPLHAQQALDKYVEALDGNGMDYNKFIRGLQENGVDFEYESHYYPERGFASSNIAFTQSLNNFKRNDNDSLTLSTDSLDEGCNMVGRVIGAFTQALLSTRNTRLLEEGRSV